MPGDWTVNAGRLWAVGLTTTAMAALGAIVVWFIATALFDETLEVRGQDGDLQELTIVAIIITTLVIGLLATGVLHLLLRFVPNGQGYFTAIGTLVLLVSLVLPLGLDVSTANKVWLSIMHVVVYAFIVPGLAGAVPRVATPITPTSS